MSKTVAVLAVQGAFIEHERKLWELGCQTVELRQAADLQKPFDALVLPGGESTVQAKLLRELDMFDALKERIEGGMPVLGTCAGLILLASAIEEDSGDLVRLKDQDFSMRTKFVGLETLPVTVQRNAYGRQLGSFHVSAQLKGEGTQIPLTFIRAPKITQVGAGVDVLVEWEGTPVAVQCGNQIGISFHPELDADLALYKKFVSLL